MKTHYDYESVLHYSSSSFAVDDDIPTIVTKDPAMQDVIGQRTHLTNCDIVRLQMLYRCIDEVNIPSSRLYSTVIVCGALCNTEYMTQQN